MTVYIYMRVCIDNTDTGIFRFSSFAFLALLEWICWAGFLKTLQETQQHHKGCYCIPGRPYGATVHTHILLITSEEIKKQKTTQRLEDNILNAHCSTGVGKEEGKFRLVNFEDS